MNDDNSSRSEGSDRPVNLRDSNPYDELATHDEREAMRFVERDTAERDPQDTVMTPLRHIRVKPPEGPKIKQAVERYEQECEKRRTSTGRKPK